MTESRRALLGVLLSILSSTAFAHKMAPSLLDIAETERNQFSVVWKTPKELSSPVPITVHFPPHCKALAPPAHQPDPLGSLLTWRIECNPRGLVGRKISINGLRENQSSALIKLSLLDERRYQQMVNAANSEYEVPNQALRSAVMWSYLELGVRHILEGIDHLFFVWALTLLLARRRLLVAITAFTLGHSVTLALAALRLVNLPQSLTELFIALSVFLLATAIMRGPESPGLIQRHVFWIGVAFGLVHGLGFAGALREIGLPQGEVVAALLMFNVGVELGQILFIVAVLIVAWAARKALTDRYSPQTHALLHRTPVYVVGSVAAFWCLDRSIGLVIG